MKNLKRSAFALSVLIVLLSVTGCSDANGMKNIQKHFETSEVIMIPGKSGHFIARKSDGSIWYGFANGILDDSVIDDVQLLPPNK